MNNEDKDTMKIKLTLEVDLNEFVEKTIKTTKELMTYYLDEMGWSKEELKDNKGYIKCKEAIEAGAVIKVVMVCNEEGSADAKTIKRIFRNSNKS